METLDNFASYTVAVIFEIVFSGIQSGNDEASAADAACVTLGFSEDAPNDEFTQPYTITWKSSGRTYSCGWAESNTIFRLLVLSILMLNGLMAIIADYKQWPMWPSKEAVRHYEISVPLTLT